MENLFPVVLISNRSASEVRECFFVQTFFFSFEQSFPELNVFTLGQFSVVGVFLVSWFESC